MLAQVISADSVPAWVAFLNSWLAALTSFALGNLVPVALILVAGLLVIRVVMNLLNKMLRKSKLEKAAHSLIRTAARATMYILLFLIVASKLGIDVTGIVALASVLTLAVSLSVQNALTNLISGFTLLYTKPFSSGDYVEIAGQAGSVKEIGLTYTKLATPDNKYVFIPNGAVTSAEIVNYTVLGKRRLDVEVSVSYDAEPEKVMETLKEIGNVPTILPEEGVFVGLQSYGDSAIKYVIRVWTDNDQYWPTMYAIHARIPGMLRQENIEMTYPHLNVHLDK